MLLHFLKKTNLTFFFFTKYIQTHRHQVDLQKDRNDGNLALHKKFNQHL